MIQSTIHLEDQFGQLGARLERAAVHALDAAAEEAALVAEAEPSIPLELEILPATLSQGDGYSAGIKSRKRTRNPKKTAPLAHIFDEGSLGKRTKPLKRPGNRKRSWEVAASDRASAHTAQRRDVDGKGIAPEHFYAKARRAGKRKLLEAAAAELA